MRRIITLSIAILALLPAVAHATGYTSPYWARHCAIGDTACAQGPGVISSGVNDNDRNKEKSSLESRGWCIASNGYIEPAVDVNNYTEIRWYYQTCKGYYIFVNFYLQWLPLGSQYIDGRASENLP